MSNWEELYNAQHEAYHRGVAMQEQEQQIQALQSQVEELGRKCNAYSDALEQIAYPIKWSQEHLPEGYEICGEGLIQLTKNPHYYQEIAQRVIKEQQQ